MDLLLTTLHSLRAHGLRFALTSLGILWGTFMLTYLSASMEGTDRHFTEQLETTGPKIVIAWPGAVHKSRVGERGARPVELDNDDVVWLDGIHRIEEVAQDVFLLSQIVRAGRRTKLLNVTGGSPATASIRGFEVAEGRFLTPTDVRRNARVAFLGSGAARRLFGNELVLGRTLQIESTRFRVIGIAVPKGDQLVNISGKDDNAVVIPYSAAQRWLLHSDEVRRIVFAPVTREQSWDAIRAAREVIGLHHDFHPDVGTALSFFNVHEVMQILHRLFFGLRVFLVSAGIITLIVGAVGVMNIMLVVVAERTSEIGLRKAVGGTSRAIFMQFLAEAAAVCGLSGLLGAAIGVVSVQLVARVSPPDGPLGSTPILDPASVVVIVGALVGVGVIAGVGPAVRAARIPPAEALRAG